MTATRGRRLRAVLFASLVVLSSVTALPMAFAGTAAGVSYPTLTASDGATTYSLRTEAVAVDPTLSVSSGSDIEGARVVLNDRQTGDELLLNDSVSTETGITGSYDSTTGMLSLSGTGTAADYEAALQGVEFRTTEQSTLASRNITFSLGDKIPYEVNGHYYEYIENSGINWTAANSTANGLAYFGLQGYLVTVTSQEENDFIFERLSGEGWIGASDTEAEGTWKWVTGPEAGKTFPPAATADFSYDNWASGEPNDSNTTAGGEDRAHYKSDGTWNDYANNDGAIQGYVVEYGGSATDPDVTWRGVKEITVVDETAPTAGASKSPTSGNEDHAINFDGSASTDSETSIVTYEWDWTSDESYDANDSTQTYTYAEPGTYTVTLRVTDEGGNNDTATLNVTVEDVTDPVADAGGDRTVTAGRSVTFDGTTSTDNVGVVAYEWDWDGDKHIDATGATATHAFSEVGNHTVRLHVTDEAGNKAHDAVNVTVVPPEPKDRRTKVVTQENDDATGGSGTFTIDSVAVGEPAEMRVSGVDTDVVVVENVAVDFDMGTNIDNEVRVSAADQPPAGVAPYDGGTLRAYVSVDIDGNLAGSVSGGRIRFRLAPEALPENPERVTVHRFHDGEWLAVQTVSEGDGRFLVITPGYSTFAVVVDGDVPDAAEVTETPTSASTHEATATPADDVTETAPTTAVPEDETETRTGSGVPGFGALVAVLALLVVVLRAKLSGR